jgi:hypothetical protein
VEFFHINRWRRFRLAFAENPGSPFKKLILNRPGFVGGSHFQIGWSRYEQNNEQILP